MFSVHKNVVAGVRLAGIASFVFLSQGCSSGTLIKHDGSVGAPHAQPVLPMPTNASTVASLTAGFADRNAPLQTIDDQNLSVRADPLQVQASLAHKLGSNGMVLASVQNSSASVLFGAQRTAGFFTWLGYAGLGLRLREGTLEYAYDKTEGELFGSNEMSDTISNTFTRLEPIAEIGSTLTFWDDARVSPYVSGSGQFSPRMGAPNENSRNLNSSAIHFSTVDIGVRIQPFSRIRINLGAGKVWGFGMLDDTWLRYHLGMEYQLH